MGVQQIPSILSIQEGSNYRSALSLLSVRRNTTNKETWLEVQKFTPWKLLLQPASIFWLALKYRKGHLQSEICEQFQK
jgi:hypothetical protein